MTDDQQRTAAGDGATADDGLLAGRVAVVTGAGSGLGLAIASALADMGATVVLTGRRVDPLRGAERTIRERGGRCRTESVDVKDAESVDRLMERVEADLGGVDILVNNAGVLRAGPLVETSLEDWDEVLGTNLRGTFVCSRAAARSMIRRGGGKIVNVASSFAFKGVPAHAAYCASKAAVVSLTRTAAVEWARHGIQVNALAPGYFATDMNEDIRADDALTARILGQIPARRMGRPHELRPWVELLAGPGSDFVTGQTFVIDGGQLAR